MKIAAEICIYSNCVECEAVEELKAGVKLLEIRSASMQGIYRDRSKPNYSSLLPVLRSREEETASLLDSGNRCRLRSKP